MQPSQKTKRLLQFGAGNIGRSFIAQIFSLNGYEVVFVDIDHKLIDTINRKGAYPVIIKHDHQEDKQILVTNVRGIYADDLEAVIKEIIHTTIIATSVGKNALPHIIPTLAAGIINRFSITSNPMNIILAENIQQGKKFVVEKLRETLGYYQTQLAKIGIIETSIGKMVPLMPPELKEQDPLIVYAEAYNSLIIDKCSFIGVIPDFPQIHAVERIDAYVDRKLYIHNLGHAAVAYLGYAKHPEATYVYEILEDNDMTLKIRRAMRESAVALQKRYPDVFTGDELFQHIEDLLQRFSNKALKDTIYRVGRDLKRKLHTSDRIIGAIRLCYEQGFPCTALLQVLYEGFHFTLASKHPQALPSDIEFLDDITGVSYEVILRKYCGLDREEDYPLVETINNSFAIID